MPRELPVGIAKTPSGFRVWQRVHAGADGLKSKRFPRTATLAEMKAWRDATRVEHRKAPRPPAERGTLAADIQRYLKLVATMPSLADRTRDLAAWEAVYGMRPRAKLTRDDYRLVLQEWRLRGRGGKPLAASTVNHRRTALMHLYRVLDGKGAPNPLREIAPFEEPPPEPRALALADVKAILSHMPQSKTKARVLVLAWTGIRGRSELGKMKPEHVDLKARVCWVPTGKHGKPRVLVLNAAGERAWRAFIDAKAWGPYQKDSLRRSFRRAIKRLNAERLKAELPPLPLTIRVYDLRHTIATALVKAGADLADVQAHLGHTSPRMTRRYAPYQPEKLRTALRSLR
jgi:integrase